MGVVGAVLSIGLPRHHSTMSPRDNLAQTNLACVLISMPSCYLEICNIQKKRLIIWDNQLQGRKINLKLVHLNTEDICELF